MPKNLTGLQAGTVQQDAVNDPSVRVIRGKNKFPQSFKHPSTCRYGEVDLIASVKCERGDVFPYKYVTELDTYTLASPIKSDVFMSTAAFKVPMQAIYPRNWEQMYTIPLKGDDVPDDNRSIFSPYILYNRLSSIISAEVSNNNLDILVRSVLLLEKVFSAGSLFAKNNMHLNAFSFISNGQILSFDRYFDLYFVPWLKENLILSSGNFANSPRLVSRDSDSGLVSAYFVVDDGDPYIGEINRPSSSSPFVKIGFRRALEMLRTGEFIIVFPDSLTLSSFPSFSLDGQFTSFSNLVLNIEPIVAYQIACSHFFTNSKVDYIYSAQLYRDNMQSFISSLVTSLPTFSYNGVTRLYDVFSQRYLTLICGNLYVDNLDAFDYLYNLFSWNRSLRYGDYFTGSHVEPLAVGDINITPQTDGSVNAIDVTRKLQLTRLLNKVNITGQRIEDYLRALFGGDIPQAPKDVPIRLSLERSSISGFEVNNTGAEQADSESQNIITTNLKLSDSKYMFEANIEEPCWIVVTRYFDAERIYSRTCDRFAFHYDRYDDFIPDMQFIGDQDVKNTELDITRIDTPFAYNLRYMEYKNRYAYASGGFIEFLPSWAFITDNRDGEPAGSHISPSYIRSSPSEFDRFYKTFAGAYSLASYFHFITDTVNVVDPYRQMVYAPEILA